MPTVTFDAREKKKRGWFLAACPLMTMALVSCESVNSFRITKGAESQVCDDVRNAIRDINPPRFASPGVCRWFAQLDTLSNDSVQAPKWLPFAPSEEQVKHMWLVGSSYFERADEKELADIWEEKYQSQWREAMRKGEYRYEQSTFDIDNDGRTERVVREVHVGCSDENIVPKMPRMRVLTDQGIDIRYGPGGYGLGNAIIVRGRTFGVAVETIRDVPENFTAGDPIQSRFLMKITSPHPPGVGHPFMQNEIVCSFETKR